MSDDHDWQLQTQDQLKHKAAELNDKQWKIYQIDFILGAILKAPAHIYNENEFAVFKKETEELIDAIPAKEDLKIFAKDFLVQFKRYKSKLLKQYKLVPKGYYIGIGLAIGIGLGASLGIAMKNIAIGIAIGTSLVIAIGSSLNAKAETEGKVL